MPAQNLATRDAKPGESRTSVIEPVEIRVQQAIRAQNLATRDAKPGESRLVAAGEAEDHEAGEQGQQGDGGDHEGDLGRPQ